MTFADIKSLFVKGLKLVDNGCLIILTALVMLSGCAGPNPSGVKPVHLPVSALIPPLPQTQVQAKISNVIVRQPQGITVPYGSIAAVYTSTNGTMRFQDIGPAPIYLTNDVSYLKEGQFAINGMTWNPNDANVVVWVHEDNWEDWLGEGTAWGNYDHWTLWASPGLETHCWVQMDCKATLSASDVQFNGGPCRPDQCFYRVTRE